MISQKKTLTSILSALLLTVGFVLLLKPIAQPEDYHQFADQRGWLNIPNAWNVLSNLPFLLAGLWGLFLLFTKKVTFINDREKWFWIGISLGLILTAIGSTYYHLAPDDSRLFWDRLAMTTVFMSLVAALIGERISLSLGLWLWPVLLAIGFYSLLHWSETGDLSFYLGLQLFTGLMLLVMLVSQSPYDRNRDLAVVFVCYALAVVFDRSDHQIYRLTGETISGHTLKHLAAALAGAWLIMMIWKRKKRNA